MAFNFLQLLWENIFEPKQKQSTPVVKREKKNKKYKESPSVRVGQKRNRSLLLSKSSKHKVPKTPIKKKQKNNPPSESLGNKDISTFTFQISPKNKFNLNPANYYSPNSILNTTQFPPNSPFYIKPPNYSPSPKPPVTPRSKPVSTPRSALSTSNSKKRKNKSKNNKNKITKITLPNTHQMADLIEISDDEDETIENNHKQSQTDYEYEVALAVEKSRAEALKKLEETDDEKEVSGTEEELQQVVSEIEQQSALSLYFPEASYNQKYRETVEDPLKLKAVEESIAKLRLKANEYEQSKQEKLRNRPLTEEEKQCVKKILYQGKDQDVIVSGFNVDLLRSDLRRLKDGEWLNDEIINFYTKLLNERYESNPSRFAKCYFFSTFFYSTLSTRGYDYQRVRRWTAKVDLFTYDKVVIPVHLGNHWTLAIINLKEKRFEYYDSLGGSNHDCFERLRRYIVDEHKDKKKSDFSVADWTNYCPKNIPHQQNGYDCGVFTCKFAESQSRNASYDFSQKDMLYSRQRMVLDIVNKKVM